MMNNIAVVLRGHYRTWGYVHPAVFDFYDKIAENVDYYVVTWRYLNQSIVQFTEPFEKYKKNLVKMLTVYPDDAYYTSYLGPSYLSYQIIPDMINNHHKNKYDFVFNTRPDIIYRANIDSPKLSFRQDTFYTSGYVCQSDGRPDSKYHIGVEDHFFASSFENNLIMNTRHCDGETMGCHNQILHHATKYGIKTAALYNMFARIVRPTAFRDCRDPFKYFDVDNFEISRKWTSMDKEVKLKVLQKYAIPEQDYITNSILAKI
jgi:hypothetical protein